MLWSLGTSVGRNQSEGSNFQECHRTKRKPVHGPDGKVLKQTIRMVDGFFDGKPSDGHPQTELFNGMNEILIERGLTKEANLQYGMQRL